MRLKLRRIFKEDRGRRREGGDEKRKQGDLTRVGSGTLLREDREEVEGNNVSTVGILSVG